MFNLIVSELANNTRICFIIYRVGKLREVGKQIPTPRGERP